MGEFSKGTFPVKPGHTWTTSSYVKGFFIVPQGNFKLFSKKFCCTLSGHPYLNSHNLQDGNNCIQINLWSKVFSAGNLSSCISHEHQHLWTTWSHVHTFSLYRRARKNKMFADDSIYIYQGIDPFSKTPIIYGYTVTVLQESEPTN